MMVFVSMSGYKSIGNLIREKIPNIITAKKQRLVIIGRLTAPSYRLINSLLYHFHFLTIRQAALTRNHDLITRVHTTENLVFCADMLTQFHLVV